MRNNGIWLWGYVLNQVPERISSVEFPTWCSLETGAHYLHADNVIAMNSCFDPEALTEEFFRRLEGCREIMLPLSHIPHGEKGDVWELRYLETARKIAELSHRYPAISSVIIDDFRDFHGPSATLSRAALTEIYATLKGINPNLKLHLVRYSWQNQDELDDVTDCFDVLNYWIWESTPHYWESMWIHEIEALARRFRKPIFQGLYIHDYGNPNGPPISVEMLKLQLPRVFHALRNQQLCGVGILQNGWLSREDHRESVWFLKNYIDYHLGVNTILG